MMTKIFTAARILMGLIFFVFGLNGLLGLFPTPSSEIEAAAFPAGYLIPFVKVVQVACGFLFLVNRFVPLATVVIAPVVVNIVLFHLFLDPTGIPVAILVATLNVLLGVAYKSSFAGLLEANARPAG